MSSVPRLTDAFLDILLRAPSAETREAGRISGIYPLLC